MQKSSDTRIPVTVLTGFLGAGKTTLLNRILSENHGWRIAVIENEFGEIGVDDDLVINADEEIFEMNNGCICCTVRGDLIRILGNLAKRRQGFDYVLIETTGLADPAPVAQTFFVDDDIKEAYRLDGVVTLVDAKHIHDHIDESDECHEQIAFADTILLNKIDLVDGPSLVALEERLRTMNAVAEIHRTCRGELPLDKVLGLGGFDIDRALQLDPHFFEPEYPFEWIGLVEVASGAELRLAEGPDPSMKVSILPVDAALDNLENAELDQVDRLWQREASPLAPDGLLEPGSRLWDLQLSPHGDTRFELHVTSAQRLLIATEHHPDEFAMQLSTVEGPVTWLATRVCGGHEHDNSVTSVGIRLEGSLDLKKLNEWIGKLLMERGQDLFRSKGILSISGQQQRFVFQAVHMLFDGNFDRPWPADKPRASEMVFIGRNLDRGALTEGFAKCLA